MSVLAIVASGTQSRAQFTVNTPWLFAELIDCCWNFELTTSLRKVLCLRGLNVQTCDSHSQKLISRQLSGRHTKTEVEYWQEKKKKKPRKSIKPGFLSLLHQLTSFCMNLGFPGGSNGKESARDVRDPCSIPGSGRFPGEGNGTQLNSSILAWRIPWTEEPGGYSP